MKVMVAMSGGVDSSLTAVLLQKDGHDVFGVSFLMHGSDTFDDAQDISKRLNIPHRIVDLKDRFESLVVKPFIEAYKNGLTPNPCIICNRYVKFPGLLDAGIAEGCDHISTGHYARMMEGGLILKGVDPAKDQSYVLYGLDLEVRKRLILPLGGMTKTDVRRMAREFSLPVSDKPESQEICFIQNNDYGAFMDNRVKALAGDILDLEGKVLGRHKGLFHYTVGQRKGLGIGGGRPLYVAKIDALNNVVVVGDRESAMRREFIVSGLRWIIEKHEAFEAGVKVRSMMKPEPAIVTPMSEDVVKVVFEKPEWAPAPGQSAVFYDGDCVIGGGVIKREE